MITDRTRRALWAWGSGVATMMLMVRLRDDGISADVVTNVWWYVLGPIAIAGMFSGAISND